MLDMVNAYLKFSKQEIDPEKEIYFTIKDKYNGDIPVVLSGSYIIGVVDGKESDTAKKSLHVLVKNLTEN